MHCGLQAGNLRDAGEPPQGFDGCCGGQAVAGAVFGGGAAGGMKVVGEARPGDVEQGAGERLQPVKEGRDAAQVFAKGGVGEGEQDLVSVAGLCRRVADPKPAATWPRRPVNVASQAERRLSSKALVVVVVPRVGRRGAGGWAGPALTGSCVAGWGLAGEVHGTSAPRARRGEGEAARGRAGRRRGRASKRGRRCCK